MIFLFEILLLHDYQRLARLMHRLRVEKSDLEVELIRKAAQITKRGFDRVLRVLGRGLALLLVAAFVVFAGLLGMLTAILVSLNERRREMAIRLAVGASPQRLLRELAAPGLRLVALGLRPLLLRAPRRWADARCPRACAGWRRSSARSPPGPPG